MEVTFGAGEASSEVVPVSFETVITETGHPAALVRGS
jgi:hypothetical protein